VRDSIRERLEGFSKMTLRSEGQDENESEPRIATQFGTQIDDSDEQPEKTAESI
jgi:hypothetical protein